jgi:uncharacterized protein
MMMRTLCLLLILPGFATCMAQDTTVLSGWRDSLDAYWSHIDAEYADSATSPLKADDRSHFLQLERFAPDSSYCVRAAFTPASPDSEPFAMKTTKTRTPMYREFGLLRFTLNGAERTLRVYQSVPPHPGYEDEVFLPFTDLTNGEETYGVGRYIDLHLPFGDHVWLDFNKAYNPYCAYNDRYSCPVPPRENHLTTRVLAGVRKFHD